MEELYDKVAADRRFKSLGIDKKIKVVKAKHSALLGEANTVDDWMEVDWLERKEAGDKCLDEYKVAFNDLLTYKSSLDIANQEKGEDKRKKVRKQQNEKNAFARKMIDGKVPEVLANHVAERLLPRKEKVTWKTSEIIIDGGSSMSLQEDHDFKKPAFLTTATSEHKTFWHGQLTESYDAVKADAIQKNQRAIDYMLKVSKDRKKPTELTHLASEVPCKHDFKWSQEGNAAFTMTEKCQLVCITQKSWTVSFDIAAMPYAGVGCFITCTSGLCWICSVAVSDVLDRRKEIEKLNEFLSNSDPSYFNKIDSAIISPGDSFWVPFATIPIIIALGPETDKDDDLKHCSFILRPVMDAERVKSESRHTLRDVKAWLTKGLAKGLKSYGSSGKNLAAWMDTWVCDGENETPETQVCEFD